MMPLWTTAILPVRRGAGERCGRWACRGWPSGCGREPVLPPGLRRRPRPAPPPGWPAGRPAADGQPAVAVEQRDARGVVSAVLHPAQRIDHDVAGRTLPDVADDSAHRYQGRRISSPLLADQHPRQACQREQGFVPPRTKRRTWTKPRGPLRHGGGGPYPFRATAVAVAVPSQGEVAGVPPRPWSHHATRAVQRGAPFRKAGLRSGRGRRGTGSTHPDPESGGAERHCDSEPRRESPHILHVNSCVNMFQPVKVVAWQHCRLAFRLRRYSRERV